jgi:hypothetical protein
VNNNRRKRIKEAIELLEKAKGILEEAGQEEGEYRDNMPESLCDSEKWYAADTATDSLESAVEEIQGQIDAVTEVL